MIERRPHGQDVKLSTQITTSKEDITTENTQPYSKWVRSVHGKADL